MSTTTVGRNPYLLEIACETITSLNLVRTLEIWTKRMVRKELKMFMGLKATDIVWSHKRTKYCTQTIAKER